MIDVLLSIKMSSGQNDCHPPSSHAHFNVLFTCILHSEYRICVLVQYHLSLLTIAISDLLSVVSGVCQDHSYLLCSCPMLSTTVKHYFSLMTQSALGASLHLLINNCDKICEKELFHTQNLTHILNFEALYLFNHYI